MMLWLNNLAGLVYEEVVQNYTLTYHINANQRVFDLEGRAFSQLYALASRTRERPRKRDNLLMGGGGGGGGREAESYDRKIT